MSAKSSGMKRVAMWATTLCRRRSKKWIRTVTFLMSTRPWTRQRRRPAWPSQVILTRLALGTCCLPMRLMSGMSRSIGGGGGVSCESMRHHTRIQPSQMSMHRRVLKMRWIWLSWSFCRTVYWSCSTSRKRRRNWSSPTSCSRGRFEIPIKCTTANSFTSAMTQMCVHRVFITIFSRFASRTTCSNSRWPMQLRKAQNSPNLRRACTRH